MSLTNNDVYTSIRVSTLRGDLKIPFDAFIKVAGKYILYCRQGDSFEGERLDRLRKKKLKTMFIVKSQIEPYRKYMNENVELAYSNSAGKPIVLRTQVIQGSLQAVVEDFLDEPDNEAYYHVLNHAAKKYMEFLLTEKEALSAMLNIKNEDASIAHHGINVATLAVDLAHHLGFIQSKPALVLKMLVGCLLHDMAHYENDFDISSDPKSLTGTNKELYLNHPRAGAEKIKDMGHLDTLVINIIFQHEEKIDGSGFPQGLSADHMDPLVVVAATANCFDRYISFKKMSYKDALKQILIEGMGSYPLEYLQGIQKVLRSRGMI